MRCRVFGTVELIDADGMARPIGSPNQRVVLAALAADRGRIVTSDALIEALWPNQAPTTAVHTLRTYVSRLRRDLADALRSHPVGYSLELAVDQIDAGVFEQLLGAAAAAEASGALTEATDRLRRALELARGPAFGTEADGPLVRGEATRLDQLVVGARVRLARLALAADAEDAVGQAEVLVAQHPYLEPAWEVLVRALVSCGRNADALRTVQRAVDAMAEIGLELSPVLREAERSALLPSPTSPVMAPSSLVAEAPPTIVRSSPPHPTSAMIGRRRDVDAVVALLQRSRLVTVVGAGGVGKTRLVTEVALRVPGAVWVDLAAVAADPDVVTAVLAALGVRASGPAGLELVAELVDLDVLVVIDNAEHVLDGAARLVDALLAASPHVRVLVTSRERLGVDGEYRWHVSPLRRSSTATSVVVEAAELFVARASMSDPTTVLDPTDARVVAVVELLDGLPLAIEMAAAQLSSMSIEELLDQLSTGVARLSAPRRQAVRQRSLSSLIEWSEQLLDADELSMFHELSVFSGPVAHADVIGLSGRPDAPTTVRRLADRSLLEADRADDGSTSFRMLTTVRDHAARQLIAGGRAPTIARRHAEWFTQQAIDADRRLRAGDETARRRFDGIRHELRVAHRMGRTVDIAQAGRLSAALHSVARYTAFDEPMAWAELAVESNVGPTCAPLGAGVWASAAARSVVRGDLAEARRRAQRAVDEAATLRDRLLGLEVAGDVALFDGRLDDASASFAQLRAGGADEGDRLYEALGVAGGAMAACYAGEARRAQDLLDSFRENVVGVLAEGWVAYTYGESFAITDDTTAMAHYERAVELAQRSGCRYLENVSRVSAGALRARVGAVDEALHSFRSLVKIWLDLGERTHQRTTLRNLVVLLHRSARPEDAAELLGSVDRGEVPAYGDDGRRLDDARAWVHATLGDDRAEQLHAQGAARDIPTAATWAIDILRAGG